MEIDLTLPQNSPIMVVDDNVAVLAALTRPLLRLGYPVKGFSDSTLARDALEAGEPVHLLITDQEMPGIDGVTLIQYALEADPNTVALMVTGGGRLEPAASAVRMGVVDYLLKPIDPGQMSLAVQRALRSRAQAIFHREAYGRSRADAEDRAAVVERQKAQLEAISLASISALVKLLEARSPHFRNHSQAVSRLAEAMATALALPSNEVEAVRVAGLLHDVGMIAIPDAIIEKGKNLSPEEVACIREHTRVAEEILRPFENLGPVVDYVLFHHERLNGSGYPEGRKGDAIPLGAQIVGLADSYVALRESRAFREAVSADEAIETLRGGEGTWFSDRLLTSLEHGCSSMEEQRFLTPAGGPEPLALSARA